MDTYKKKVKYYPFFNDIRGFAALLVLIHHVVLYLIREGNLIINNNLIKSFYSNCGKVGVYYFFVLSGFLIIQKLSNNDYTLNHFYKKRVVRILPLYFIILIISFFILPLLKDFTIFNSSIFYTELININLEKNLLIELLLGIFMLPNFISLFGTTIPGFSQSWSIGVEEQFYIIIPLVILKIKRIKPLHKVLILTSILVFWYNIEDYYFIRATLRYFIAILIGGSISLLNINKFNIGIRNNLSAYSFLIISSITCSLIYTNYLFLMIIISLNILVFSNYTKTNKHINYIGKISYGVYMWHPAIMYLTYGLIIKFITSSFYINATFLIIVTTLSIIISSISFKYIENPLNQLLKNENQK